MIVNTRAACWSGGSWFRAATTGVRWLVCALVSELGSLLYPVQTLHGVAVAGLGIGGPLYVESSVPERQRASGRGLYAAAGGGIGGVFSNVTGERVLRVNLFATFYMTADSRHKRSAYPGYPPGSDAVGVVSHERLGTPILPKATLSPGRPRR